MSKPIFLVQLPFLDSIEQVKAVEETLSKKLIDWHVLVIMSSVSDIQFSAYSEQAATDIELENFKEMIQNQINALK